MLLSSLQRICILSLYRCCQHSLDAPGPFILSVCGLWSLRGPNMGGAGTLVEVVAPYSFFMSVRAACVEYFMKLTHI